jgi:hypothetical protein
MAASAGGSDAEKSNGCGLAGIKPDQAGLATIAWGCQGRQTIKVPGETFQLLETFRRGDRRLRPWKAESVLEWRTFGRWIGDTRLSPILASPNAGGCPMTTASAFRQREWRRRRRESWRQYCASCESVFVPGRRDAVFCSAACAQRDYRRRKASGETASRRATVGPWRVFEAARPPRAGATPEAAPEAPGAARRIDVRALIG